MANRRFEMFEYRQVLTRMRLGDTDRAISRAGLMGRRKLFEPAAVEALAQSARGVPRLINRIAHYALTAAAAKGARTVSAEHFEHAVAELRL